MIGRNEKLNHGKDGSAPSKTHQSAILFLVQGHPAICACSLSALAHRGTILVVFEFALQQCFVWESRMQFITTKEQRSLKSRAQNNFT
jgi:hypothetical protein